MENKRWEELEKEFKDLVEKIDKEFPNAYLDIGVAFMGKSGVYLTECFLCKDYIKDVEARKIYNLFY